jgi:hypothetical protein
MEASAHRELLASAAKSALSVSEAAEAKLATEVATQTAVRKEAQSALVSEAETAVLGKAEGGIVKEAETGAAKEAEAGVAQGSKPVMPAPTSEQALEEKLLVQSTETQPGPAAEGLTQDQLRRRQQLSAERERLITEIEKRSAPRATAETRLSQARTDLIERREELRRLQQNRRTPYTTQNEWSETRYREELKTAEKRVERADRKVSDLNTESDRLKNEYWKLQSDKVRVGRALEDLANLERGLSEATEEAKGIFGEVKAHDWMEAQGYKKIDFHDPFSPSQGIDGIYMKFGPPKEYVIIEAK